MQELDFGKIVKDIISKDPRYDAEAYSFTREAVDFTVKTLDKPIEGPDRHISGRELLDGIRQYALQEFGPMALTVFRIWGINNTSDFGEMVFALVDSGVLGKTEQDNKEDFANGYDFNEAFAKPFLPEKPLKQKKAKPQTASSQDLKPTKSRKPIKKTRRKKKNTETDEK
ncbi:Minf_1886 family protein [Verrucomicrobiota bacterium]